MCLSLPLLSWPRRRHATPEHSFPFSITPQRSPGLVRGVDGFSRRMEFLKGVDIVRYPFADMILLVGRHQFEYTGAHFVHRALIGFDGLLLLRRPGSVRRFY